MRGVNRAAEIIEVLGRRSFAFQGGEAGVFPDEVDLRAGRKPPRKHGVEVEGVVGVVAVAAVVDRGFGTARGQRLFMLDAAGERLRALPADAGVRLAASTDRGRILNPVARPNPEAAGWRASFELAPEDNRAAELRATLMQGDAPVSETWVYRWTA